MNKNASLELNQLHKQGLFVEKERIAVLTSDNEFHSKTKL